jgi:L-ribulose-5-phosphate 3-epimerase
MMSFLDRKPLVSRREFIGAAASITAGVAAGRVFSADTAKIPDLKKAVKYEMVEIEGTATDKFKLLKKLGFLGVEIDSPSKLNLDDLIAAKEATGIQIHGVIDSVHWQDTLSSPDEKVRAKGLAALRQAIADAKKVGADTVLLVPGVVDKDTTYDQCWERSTAEVKKAIPDAEKAKVKIAIETVWNNFITGCPAPTGFASLTRGCSSSISRVIALPRPKRPRMNGRGSTSASAKEMKTGRTF